jgi:hypothetical protein
MKLMQPKLIPAEEVKAGVAFKWCDNFYHRIELPANVKIDGNGNHSVLATTITTGQLTFIRPVDLVQIFPEATVVLEGIRS